MKANASTSRRDIVAPDVSDRMRRLWQAATGDVISDAGFPASSLTGRVIEADRVGEALQALLAEAAWSVDTALPYVPTGDEFAESLELEKRLLSREVSVRVLLPALARADTDAKRHASNLTDYGGEMRAGTWQEGNCVIIDRCIAVVSVSGTTEAHDGDALLAYAPGAVQPVSTLFEQSWRNGFPIHEAARSQRKLTRRDLLILKAIGRGELNKDIAVKVGVSPGHLDKELRRLRERFGVSTKAALAVEAQRLGRRQR